MSKFKEDKIAGGLAAGMTLNDIAEKHGVSIDMLVAEFKKGIGVEMEHTTDREVAKEIALDHLFEDPKYYTKLIDMEKGMNESAMGELDIMAKQSSNFKDFVKTFQKEFPLIQIDREAIKWLEGIYNDRTNESVNEAKTYKKGDKLKIKLKNGKKFDVVFVDYSRTKGIAYGKFKDGGEVVTKPFSLDFIVESVNEGIGTIALGVAGGLLLLNVLKLVLKKVVGGIGMNVALQKEKLHKTTDELFKQTLITGGKLDMMSFMALRSVIKEMIDNGQIAKLSQIIKVI